MPVMLSIVLPRQTGEVRGGAGSAYSEILRLRPTGFAQNDRYIDSIN